MLHCPTLGPPTPDPRHQHLLQAQALTLQRHIFARSGGWVVKGEWGIAERQSRLALQRDFRGMFTLAIKCRLEPVLLSRFSPICVVCMQTCIRHRRGPSFKVFWMRVAHACSASLALGHATWFRWTKEGLGKTASPVRHRLIVGSFVGQRGCF